jgi:hypothetical protein
MQHENAASVGEGRFDGIMIAADHLKRIAAWSREMKEREIEVARAGIVEKSYRASFMRGDRFEYWTGVVSGLARMGTVSRGGKAISFAGLTAGAWLRPSSTNFASRRRAARASGAQTRSSTCSIGWPDRHREHAGRASVYRTSAEA